MRNASALTGNTKDISTHILGGDKRHYDSFSCDQHYFCSFLYSFYDIWVQHFFPPKFLKVCLILASYVIISNMSILYNMFHIFSFHTMFSFMKSNQAWLLCDHVCLPIFCLLHYFYSLLTLILCHSASKSLYPKIKLQEKAGGKKNPSHSPGWFYLLFLIMWISFLI